MVINNGDTIRPGGYVVYKSTSEPEKLCVGRVDEIIAFPDGVQFAGMVVAQCSVGDMAGVSPYYFPRCVVNNPTTVTFLMLEVQYHNMGFIHINIY